MAILFGTLMNYRGLENLETRMEKRFDKVDARFDRIEARLDRMQADLGQF